MKLIQIIFSIVAIILMGCNKTESLDKYYVTHQEKQGFMTVDVPISILKIDKNRLTKNQQEAFSSVRKLNFLGYKRQAADDNTFEAEKQKLKTILKNKKYQALLKFHHDDKLGVVKYKGNPNAIDELVLFGAEDSQGFAVVRVLGNDMNPQKIFELLHSLKKENINTEELNKIANFFKN